MHKLATFSKVTSGWLCANSISWLQHHTTSHDASLNFFLKASALYSPILHLNLANLSFISKQSTGKYHAIVGLRSLHSHHCFKTVYLEAHVAFRKDLKISVRAEIQIPPVPSPHCPKSCCLSSFHCHHKYFRGIIFNSLHNNKNSPTYLFLHRACFVLCVWASMVKQWRPWVAMVYRAILGGTAQKKSSPLL